jgi:hypothetical protein
MADKDAMPRPAFDPSTGYVILTNGECTQVVGRLANDVLWVLWKRTKPHVEVPVTLEMLFSGKDR